jgi:hypothetical protein
VADEKPATMETPISLNEVVRITLENAKRMLHGSGRSSAGRSASGWSGRVRTSRTRRLACPR